MDIHDKDDKLPMGKSIKKYLEMYLLREKKKEKVRSHAPRKFCNQSNEKLVK